MLKTEKNGSVCETDSSLEEKFRQAGFGRDEGSRLLLSPLEAAYLAHLEKTKFESGTLSDFIKKQAKTEKEFAFAFSVYATVRKTGRVIVPAGNSKEYFRAYAPGVGRLENRPYQLVRLMPGKSPSLKEVVGGVKIAHLERLELIIACGTAAEPKFYKVASFNF